MTKQNKLTPVVKWAGGKRQLLNQIEKYIPQEINTYFEPFVGGGAVLFHLHPKNAIINDLNKDLMVVYRVIKNNPYDLINSLKTHKNISEYLYKIRDLDRDNIKCQKLSDVEKASRLIYLNKTCFNGLFRVNRSGHFNTSFGNYRNPNIVNEDGIMMIHNYFNESNVTILSGDFSDSVTNAIEGDFIYFDPPYDPISNTSSFTGYNGGGFNREEQIRLKELCDQLNQRKVKFLISNSSTEFIRNLYQDYIIETVNAKRSINSNGDKRGKVEES